MSKYPLQFKVGLLLISVQLFLLSSVLFLNFETPSLKNELMGPHKSAWLGYALFGKTVTELLVQGAVSAFVFGAVAIFLSVLFALLVGFWLSTLSEKSPAHSFFYFLMETLGCVPHFLLAAVILYGVGPGLWSLSLAFACASWESAARLAWSLGRLTVSRPLYQASQSLGYSSVRLFWRLYLPEVFGPLAAKFCTLLARFITFGASACVLGLIDERSFAWGSLINQGRQYFDVAPHILVSVVVVVFVTTFALTMLSSGFHLLFEGKKQR